MPVATLSHQMYAPVSCGSGSHAEVLDAIYTLLTATHDYKGDLIAKPLSVQREISGTTKAVYWSYFEGLADVKGIIGGDGAATPTMRSGHTTAADALYGACAKGASGAYGTWSTSPVWAGATFSNYYRLCSNYIGLDNSLSPSLVWGWSSGETVWLVFQPRLNTYTAMPIGVWGSLWDARTSVAPAGESDESLNGFGVSGTTGVNCGDWITAFPVSTNQTVFSTYSSTNGCRTMVFDGGGSGTDQVIRENLMVVHSVNVRKNKLGQVMPTQVNCRIDGGASGNRWLGRIREVYIANDARNGEVLQIGGADVGYYAGPGSDAPVSAWLLKAS